MKEMLQLHRLDSSFLSGPHKQLHLSSSKIMFVPYKRMTTSNYWAGLALMSAFGALIALSI